LASAGSTIWEPAFVGEWMARDMEILSQKSRRRPSDSKSSPAHTNPLFSMTYGPFFAQKQDLQVIDE
jgi:hypothetical protein